uniref:IPT/TIG domain-containing protein n=1 Tax=Paramoeba aestuarina TaxID=180227 RepID=A0A7S4UQT4_9EUKA
MGARYLHVLAKVLGVTHDTYLNVRLLLADSGRPSSSSSRWNEPPTRGPDASPNLRIELKEFPNVDKAFLTKRPLPQPKPSVQLFGDDTALDRRSLLVAVSIVNFYTNEILEEENLQHNHPLPIVSGQCVSFPKLTITKTSKSFNDCLFCLQFDLRYYRDFSAFSAARGGGGGDGTEEEELPYQILHSIRSKAFRTISHAETITVDPSLPIPPPTLFEIIPESTDDTGEMKLAILGQNFVNQPSTLRINFGGSWGVPQYRSSKTLLCIPPRRGPGGVEVSVSNDGVQWSNSLSFTFHCHLPEGVVEGEWARGLQLNLDDVF